MRGRSGPILSFGKSTGDVMWTCIRCEAKVLDSDAEPAVDSFGCYFVCRRCSRRNTLINASSTGTIVLIQAPDKKPRWIARNALLFP